ncbi:MAG: S-methyl-5-thioribose-1-phosphate isomerase [Bdellovibrionales bacterium]|nr:S-methyl-5-thioribose-1-phosphate isomerase [Bdellovibrionales bacterium]
MKVDGKHYYTIWKHPEDISKIQIIDQRHLPHRFVIEDITTVDQMVAAIRDMHLRGAIIIGAAAGYGVYLAAREAAETGNFDQAFKDRCDALKAARPTAVNLEWGVNRTAAVVNAAIDINEKIHAALQEADDIALEEIDRSQRIGAHGLSIIKKLSQAKGGEPVNILTHCNAGWLACIDHGTATAPIYAAYDAGIDVHVWVDETRPRNQGARLTAWELGQHGVKHTVIVDNTGGHLMQNGMVDLVIVGTDRTTSNGDVVNKIGTYLKALAAHDNGVPFYVALPSSSIDWELQSGSDVPIELRGEEEVTSIWGESDGELLCVRLTPKNSPAANYAFDVTPAHLVTGLITELGVSSASAEGLREHFNNAR